MRGNHKPIEELRTAIDCLPVDTRVAMLTGVRSNDIIVGAYTDRRGGICPMLAAHRQGGRTNLISFARSWDRFTRAKGRPRRASERELAILTAHLEASLLAEDRTDMRDAIREHRELLARRTDRTPVRKPALAPEAPRPGDPYRGRELRHRRGWAWLRPFRRWDEYSRAVDEAQAEREELANGESAGPRQPAGV